MPPAKLFRILLFFSALACGAGLQAAKPDTWVEVKSPHFVAYSDAGEAEARRALKGFEGIRSVFSQVFPGIRVDPPKPMIVLVVEDEASMKRFLPEEFEGKDPKRPAGVFVSGPDRNYAILRLDVDHQMDQPYFVLFHEYTHSIVHQNFPSLPTWLDEGIADFYGATEIKSGHVLVGRVPVGRLILLQGPFCLPLETLLTVTHDSPYYHEGAKTGIFYAQSWAFVHYLFMDAKAQKAGLLRAYLKAFFQGGDPLAAAREGLGDLARLQGTLNLYNRQSGFRYWNLPLTVKLTDQDFQSRKLGEADALLVQAEFLQYTQHEEASRPLLARALALAPQLPEVHVALGVGHFLQGEKEQARSEFEAALRLGSQDFRAPYYLATLAQGGTGQGPQDSAQILRWLESARSLRPDFPGIHMALCRQYAWEPRDPAKALQEGRTAVELEPQNLANRANLGIACMNLDLENEAKTIGSQLDQLATTQDDKRIAASYASGLAQFLERRRALASANVPPVPKPAPTVGAPPPVNLGPPLKFSLPTYLAPFGNEVLRLVAEGKTDEAIRKVKEALAGAKQAYDRRVLGSLLVTLRKRAAAAKASAAPLPATPESGPSTPPAQPGVKPLKFWLPDTQAALGREVQVAVMQGRLDEAIQLVKAAIPKAKGPYEKASLKALLDHLKARKAGY